MKKLLAMMLVAAASVVCWAAEDQDEVSVVIGDSQELAVAYPIQEIRCEDANVKIRRSGNKSVTVTGVSAGQAVVELVGGADVKTFVVTVVDQLQPIIKAIGRDLEEVPEVEISVNNGKICLRGEIAKTEHWDLYHLVLSRYQSFCFDYVIFTPGQELLKKFGKILEQSGYRIVAEATSDNPGCIEMKYAGGTLTMTGYFFNKNDVAEVEKIVSRQSWLSMGGKDAKAGSVPCISNFYVVDRLIDVGVVFVTISKEALEHVGNMSEDVGSLGEFQLVTDLLKTFAGDGGSESRSVTTLSYNGGLKGVLSFLAAHDISTSRKAGHLTFNSNGEKAAKATFRDGGTLLMKIPGNVGGDMKEVEYGLKLEVEGILTHADEVKLQLDLEDSGSPIAKNGDYTIETVSVKMPVVACLGETLAVGGAHKVTHTEQPPSGWMFLRWIPIVSWFAAGATDDVTDRYTLVLVSPEYADEFEPLRRRPSEETEKSERTAARDLPKAMKTLFKPVDPWYTSFYFWRWFDEEDK